MLELGCVLDIKASSFSVSGLFFYTKMYSVMYLLDRYVVVKHSKSSIREIKVRHKPQKMGLSRRMCSYSYQSFLYIGVY